MQHDPVVAMAAEIKSALQLFWAADDARDENGSRRQGEIWTNLLYLEREMAPTSNEGAAQKLRNVAASAR